MLFKKSILSEKLRRLFAKDKGAVAIITALLITTFVGFAALTIDVGVWHSQKRELQTAADAGAVGGVLALAKVGAASINSYANRDLALNGCTSGPSCNVTINHPPTSGVKAGDSSSVEVILTKPASLYLSGLFLGTPPTIYARAVAGQNSGPACMILLGTSGTDLDINGSNQITATNCGIQINSSSTGALFMSGASARLTTTSVNVVGTATGNLGNIVPSSGLHQGSSSLADPYASLASVTLTPGACTQTNYTIKNKTQTISPGTYCGGITAQSGANLTMSPGVYYLVNNGGGSSPTNAGNFSVTSNANVTGTGVTIILMTTGGSTNYGSVSMSGNGIVTLTAPTTTAGLPAGLPAGILFYGRQTTGTDTFSGGGTLNMNGVLYFPNDTLNFSGNPTVSGLSSCNHIVAQRITMSGTANINMGNGCQTPGFGGFRLFE